MSTSDDNPDPHRVADGVGRLGRRTVLAAPLALTLPGGQVQGAPQPAANAARRKVLRVAFRGAETSFDPAKISDLYSRVVTSHIFESLYSYDHLARPVKVVPALADGMPESSDDFRVWTVRIQRGIYFADDPAFKGQRRELTAEDILYPFKRLVDPANKSPGAISVLEDGILGLAEARKAALDTRKPFDYDAPIAGLKALDRYTVRFTLAEPRPRFVVSSLVGGSVAGAQAREVVEFYGDQIDAHPVGTGPFRLKQWVRSSRIVLERNPQYRERTYDAQPAPDDAEGQALLARFKGRRLPMVDEVRVSIIEEAQPIWLAFLNAEVDGLVTSAGQIPPELITVAAPGGKLAPHLARRGVQLRRSVLADTALMYFNMEDPVVGGLAPEKVALRRAISLAYDIGREINLIRRGQATPAQSMMVPFTSGYDPAYKSEMSEYDPARARALLDLYGYVDKDGDGWREMPDGKPLVLRYSSEPQQIYRQYNDLMRSSMNAVGLRCEFEIQQWPAHLKQARAGSLQIWSLGLSAGDPDGLTALSYFYGPQAGEQNLARFKLPEMDRLYVTLRALPDGPEREKLFLEAKRLATAYMPYRYQVHRLGNDIMHPWLVGFRRGVFWSYWWHMVDIDTERQPSVA
jgi:ABC-type transport system substrate-binding protein